VMDLGMKPNAASVARHVYSHQSMHFNVPRR
jgi:hypothetical protein